MSCPPGTARDTVSWPCRKGKCPVVPQKGHYKALKRFPVLHFPALKTLHLVIRLISRFLKAGEGRERDGIAIWTL